MTTTYTAKLVIGGIYIYKGTLFEKNVALPVSKEDADYLGSVVDHRLIEQGDNFQRITVPVFEVAEILPTVQEKVLEEIQTAPDTLKPKK